MYFHKQFPVLTSARNDVQTYFFLQSMALLPFFAKNNFCWSSLFCRPRYEPTRKIFRLLAAIGGYWHHHIKIFHGPWRHNVSPRYCREERFFVSFFCSCSLSSVWAKLAMPPMKRRQVQLEKSLEKAREVKWSWQESSSATGSIEAATGTIYDDGDEPSGLSQLLTMSDDALDTEDDKKDPTFDLDSSMKEDEDHMMDTSCEEWSTHLG